MPQRVQRTTVDVSAYPDLVVVYLGMRVNGLRGIRTILGLGPQIRNSWQERPDGLLLHEDLIWSLVPPHAGMRQYWRDFESLESWTRSDPHRRWWKNFLRDSGATGFWHESYSASGRIEGIYDDMPSRTGMARFAPLAPARGTLFSARGRLQRGQPAAPPPPVREEELYADAAASLTGQD
ncbi:MAG: phenylacetaldoxime dehydratase family protein [Streptosporangiaceae bacterium]